MWSWKGAQARGGYWRGVRFGSPFIRDAIPLGSFRILFCKACGYEPLKSNTSTFRNGHVLGPISESLPRSFKFQYEPLAPMFVHVISKKGPYILHMLCRNCIRWTQVKFFILSENLLLRESPFHIVNYLTSFDILNTSRRAQVCAWNSAHPAL